MLRPRLARPDRTLRLLDIEPLTAGPDEETVEASVTDLGFMTAAARARRQQAACSGYWLRREAFIFAISCLL